MDMLGQSLQAQMLAQELIRWTSQHHDPKDAGFEVGTGHMVDRCARAARITPLRTPQIRADNVDAQDGDATSHGGPRQTSQWTLWTRR